MNKENCELIASVKKYDGRDDLIEWLGKFPTKYKGRVLNNILSQARHNKLILWSKEPVFDRRSRDMWIEDGITLL